MPNRPTTCLKNPWIMVASRQNDVLYEYLILTDRGVSVKNLTMTEPDHGSVALDKAWREH